MTYDALAEARRRETELHERLSAVAVFTGAVDSVLDLEEEGTVSQATALLRIRELHREMRREVFGWT